MQNKLALWSAVMLLTACGGGGSGNGDENPVSSAAASSSSLSSSSSSVISSSSSVISSSSSAISSSSVASISSSSSSEANEEPREPEPTPGEASVGCDIGAVPDNLQVSNVLLTLPEGYDGNTPTPLVFAFHGRNRNNVEMRETDARTVDSSLERNYVMAYLKSQADGYEINADFPRFEAALDQLLSELCIDTGAIFAMGTSNGAQFIDRMLGHDGAAERRFAGVATVASSFQNPPWDPVPALVIHGLDDVIRAGAGEADGSDNIRQHVESNQCSTTTEPYPVSSCNSLVRNESVNPGCVEYTGCSERTVFCNHDDPNYFDGNRNIDTNHGWPCFANDEIFNFFESLR